MTFYVEASPDDAIRQGDIFCRIPQIDLDLHQLNQLQENGDIVDVSWMELVEKDESCEITGIVGIRAVWGIVITQDCDAVRSPDISLCEILNFRKIEGRAKDTKSPKSWASIITQQARLNQKWFYLPASKEIGFPDRMGADFRSVIRVGRQGLEAMRVKHRVARLNDIALAHFRERVGEFFRRYAYDEWYPLTKEELAEYAKNKPEPIEAFPWQKE